MKSKGQEVDAISCFTCEYVSPSETDWSSLAHQKMEAMPWAQPNSMLKGVTTCGQHSRQNTAH